LIRRASGEERLQFVEAELGQAEAVAPDDIRSGLIVLRDYHMILGREGFKAAILPVRRIEILLRGDVVGRPLRQQRQTAGEACCEEDGIRHLAWRHDRWSDGPDLVMFPGQLIHQADRVG